MSSRSDNGEGTPPYKKYRARKRLRKPQMLEPTSPARQHSPGRRGPTGTEVQPSPGQPRPRQRPQQPREPHQPAATPQRRDSSPQRHGKRRRVRVPGASRATRWTIGRVIRLALKLAFWWIAISLVVFLVSAQIHQTKLDGDLLGGAGFPLTSPNNVLVLGSDARPKGSKEPGASSSGSRSDTIMLLRVGGGANSKLSIPRDTLVNIPGHGLDKINAAYAYGGAELSVQTVEQYLGIEVNHVMEVNFDSFPKLIDSMGGVTYKGSCVVSKINGGYKNGGYTLRLKSGRTHIDGKQALALARTRKNLCNPRENDLARVQRQQKILNAMKWRMLSPGAFVRLPWIAWQAPQTLRTDMSGPTQLGLFGGMMIGGGSSTHVLKPDGVATSPGGGAALTVSPARKQAAVRRFMRG